MVTSRPLSMWDDERTHPWLMAAGYVLTAAVGILCSCRWPWGFAA